MQYGRESKSDNWYWYLISDIPANSAHNHPIPYDREKGNRIYHVQRMPYHTIAPADIM